MALDRGELVIAVAGALLCAGAVAVPTLVRPDGPVRCATRMQLVRPGVLVPLSVCTGATP